MGNSTENIASRLRSGQKLSSEHRMWTKSNNTNIHYRSNRHQMLTISPQKMCSSTGYWML